MNTIGVVTSGGDAPGMNAALRAITRVACANKIRVLGFEKGWEGLIGNNFRSLTPRSVGGILELGGTILCTARCPGFKTEKGICEASETLARNKIDGLVVIGGDGSFRGANELSEKTDTLIIGVPASIDNNVYGTDETIGFDTAVNTAVAAIDKIRDTAISHERIFVVEVMGRTRGFLALSAGLTAGAEVILVPELKLEISQIVQTIRQNREKGKKSGIIVAAEGVGDVKEIAKEVESQTGSEVRISTLGYAQRGGSPTARSRLLACLFGDKAVNLLLDGQKSNIVGVQYGKITATSLEKTCNTKKPLDLDMLQLANVLAT